MELWIRERFSFMMNFANVIMRVPPLFVIDELLMFGLDIPDEAASTLKGTAANMTSNVKDYNPFFNNVSNHVNSVTSFTNISAPISYKDYPYKLLFLIMMRFAACFLGFAASICFFMLSTKHLIIAYRYIVSVGVIFLSYWSNAATLDAIISFVDSRTDGGSSVFIDILKLKFLYLLTDGPGMYIIRNHILQSLLSLVFCSIHLGPKLPTLHTILALSFTEPSILGLHYGVHPFLNSLVQASPVLSVMLPLAVCKFVLWRHGSNIFKTIYRGYQSGRVEISNYGLSALAESEWQRLNVPCVLRTFWLIRVAEQLFSILSSEYGQDFNYYMTIKTLMVNGCETLTAVLGMTSIVSYICHYIGCFFQWVLLIDDIEERSFGTVSAMLFYMLALQTGLTSLDKENRLLKLCRNLCLLLTAVLHFVHNIVNPLLMSLSASHNPALHRHIRALGVCLFLIVSPIALLVYLWSHYTISTWLLAVSVFSIEVLVKVFVSLVIYGLFLYDALYKTFWEQLDDYVYIIRAFGNTVEFAFGIILFFNGFWILVFEAGGAIRAVMMCIHAYFNLWCEAKAGWSVFMKRRTAVNKINSLPEATEEQLELLSDVCAICYQEMESAKITICKHYFHGVCLRKWLYVQDKCPLCHVILYKLNSSDNEESLESNNQENSNEDINIAAAGLPNSRVLSNVQNTSSSEAGTR